METHENFLENCNGYLLPTLPYINDTPLWLCKMVLCISLRISYVISIYIGGFSCIRTKVYFTEDLSLIFKNCHTESEVNGLYSVTHIIKSNQGCITINPSFCMSSGSEMLGRRWTYKKILCPYLVSNTVPQLVLSEKNKAGKSMFRHYYYQNIYHSFNHLDKLFWLLVAPWVSHRYELG